MPVSVLSVAKKMGEVSGWKLTHLAMQKLCYIAHMAYLGEHDGEPLVFGNFEAWEYGPVHPQLYHALKNSGKKPVRKDVFAAVRVPEDPQISKLIEEVVNTLSDSTPRLVAITHWPKGAWSEHYVPGVKGIVIPNEDILREYEARKNEQKT